MAKQLLTLTERMYSLAQDIGATERGPFGERGEPHTAHLFGDGLRNDIFRVLPAAGMSTFLEVVDRATWIEREQAVAHAR